MLRSATLAAKLSTKPLDHLRGRGHTHSSRDQPVDSFFEKRDPLRITRPLFVPVDLGHERARHPQLGLGRELRGSFEERSFG